MSTRAMTRTVRLKGRACGIIGDMIRVLGGLAAWLGGTAAAVGMAWFGAGMVVRNTVASPPVPVVSAAPAALAPASATPAAPASAAAPASSSASARPSVPARPSAVPRPSAAPSRPAAAPSPSGQPHSYTLDGGQVTLLMTQDSAQLATAVPEAGWAVQTWSGPDWLRVDFSSGTQVSSLIASWNGAPPSVTVTNG
jgi:hypothetical protein